jgi:hypothetical protein
MKEKRIKELIYLDENSFNQLPHQLKKDKLDYQKLYSKIKKREKHLKSLKETYDRKRIELNDWKKEQTEMFNSIIELHSDLVPTISLSFSGKPKDWGIRNNSWSITMRLKGRIFSPYIGTDKNVRLRLNKLTDSDDYWNEYDNQLTSNKTDKKELEKVLKGYIEPNIIKKLVRLNKSFNGFEEWCKLYENKKLKGMDFLKEV